MTDACGIDWSFFIVFLMIHTNGLRCYITLVHLDDLEQRHLIKRAGYGDDVCRRGKKYMQGVKDLTTHPMS